MLRKITCAVALATIAIAPLAARADDSARLLAEQRFTTIKSFELNMVFRSPKGEFVKNLTYVAPDRLRLDIPSQKIVAVTIGNFVWFRDPENKWHKQPAVPGKDPMAVVHSLTKVAESLKNKVVTYVGNETLDGVATHVYRLKALPRPGFSGISRKVVARNRRLSAQLEESNGPFSMRATYTKLNAPLSVAAE